MLPHRKIERDRLSPTIMRKEKGREGEEASPLDERVAAGIILVTKTATADANTLHFVA